MPNNLTVKPENLDPDDEVAFGSALTTIADVDAWRIGAGLEFGDASSPVCQMFFRFEADIHGYEQDALACGWSNGRLILVIGGGSDDEVMAIPLRAGKPELTPSDDLVAFGATPITGDVWAVSPSLNIPGVLHGFVVLYGVPTPAPWEQRIVLASS